MYERGIGRVVKTGEKERERDWTAVCWQSSLGHVEALSHEFHLGLPCKW